MTCNMMSNSMDAQNQQMQLKTSKLKEHHSHHPLLSSSFISTMAMTEKISCYTALFLALMLAMSMCQGKDHELQFSQQQKSGSIKNKSIKPRCDEMYMVGEGETLHSIIDKCGDPYIVEENPHIHDPDDVFPGLVIKVTPHNSHR